MRQASKTIQIQYRMNVRLFHFIQNWKDEAKEENEETIDIYELRIVEIKQHNS